MDIYNCQEPTVDDTLGKGATYQSTYILSMDVTLVVKPTPAISRPITPISIPTTPGGEDKEADKGKGASCTHSIIYICCQRSKQEEGSYIHIHRSCTSDSI